GGPDDPAALQPPNSTDDVLLFADIVRVLAEGVFAGEWPADADALARKLRAREKPFFAPDGERRSGGGGVGGGGRPAFLGGRPRPPGARVPRVHAERGAVGAGPAVSQTVNRGSRFRAS